MRGITNAQTVIPNSYYGNSSSAATTAAQAYGKAGFIWYDTSNSNGIITKIWNGSAFVIPAAVWK